MVVPIFFHRIVALILFVSLVSNLLPLASAQQEIPLPDRIDFDSQILPILEQRCFECHSESKSEGDLRLDSEAAVRRGGHTGNQIVAGLPTDSELFRRITSTEIGYRMPKTGEALSMAELELFRQWIEQGAVWPTSKSLTAQTGSNIDYWGERLNHFSNVLAAPRFRYLQFVIVPILVWVLFVMASNSARRRARQQARPNILSGLASFGWGGQTISLLSILGVSAWLFQFGINQELSKANQDLTNQLAREKRVPFQVSLNPENLTLPPHPLHPRRLGGTYYRGNDERSPALFNGGFYRTATLELWLVDGQDRRYQWNDEIPDGPVSISLKIQRGPGTTPLLFSEAVFQATYLRRFRQSSLVEDSIPAMSGEIALSELTPEQLWEARIPLEPAAQWQNGVAEGMIYLFYGAQTVDGTKGRVHFGIKYNLKLVDGKISNESELWMGSTYDLGGHVLIPREGEILLDQWFDFRPIPEIEGENTHDAKLLGIPEHLDCP